MNNLRGLVVILCANWCMLSTPSECSEYAHEADVNIKPIQPAGSSGTIYDIIASVKRLYPKAQLEVFHYEGKGKCFGVIKLGDSDLYLVIIDPKVMEEFHILINGKERNFGYLNMAEYGMTLEKDGKWREDRSVHDTRDIGFLVKIHDAETVVLNALTATVAGARSYKIRLKRPSNGAWKIE